MASFMLPGVVSILAVAAVASSCGQASAPGSGGPCAAHGGFEDVEDASEGLSLLQHQATATSQRKAHVETEKAHAEAEKAHVFKADTAHVKADETAKAIHSVVPAPVVVVVAAPFNPPAPSETSLIDWWTPAGKWIGQVINYDRLMGGMALMDNIAPTPAPAPYARALAGTMAPPTIYPIVETAAAKAAIEAERLQAWRDCTVATWSAWSCCGCEHPPNYNDFTGSFKVRYREVTTPHAKFGRSCPPESEVVDCVLGAP